MSRFYFLNHLFSPVWVVVWFSSFSIIYIVMLLIDVYSWYFFTWYFFILEKLILKKIFFFAFFKVEKNFFKITKKIIFLINIFGPLKIC